MPCVYQYEIWCILLYKMIKKSMLVVWFINMKEVCFHIYVAVVLYKYMTK